MNTRISVTDKNIREAKVADPTNCPIARALKRTVTGIKKVHVYGRNANMTVKKGNKTTFYTAILDKAAAGFISRFDAGMSVNPFKLSINWKRSPTSTSMF